MTSRMRALSIHQPYVEQILRGTKRIEYRNIRTRIIGERFYLYATKKPAPEEAWTDFGAEPGELAVGLLLGTAVITDCTAGEVGFEWHLATVKRLKRPRRPKRQPQPIWFYPF